MKLVLRRKLRPRQAAPAPAPAPASPVNPRVPAGMAICPMCGSMMDLFVENSLVTYSTLTERTIGFRCTGCRAEFHYRPRS